MSSSPNLGASPLDLGIRRVSRVALLANGQQERYLRAPWFRGGLMVTQAVARAASRLKQAAGQACAFANLLHDGDTVALELRLEAATTGDLRDFAAGLRQDEAAVRAALVEPWSNEPVEG